MFLLNLTTFLFFGLVTSAGLSLATGAVIPSDLSYHDIWTNPLSVALTAIAVAVTMVIVLTGCAFLCPCRDRFANIEDDNPFPGMDFPNPPRGVDLGIYPPVEGTPDHVPVSFDPLPDLSSLMRHKMLAQSNVARLRPKVSHIVRDRQDSEEDKDSALYRDSVQSKLNKLLTTSGKQNFQREQLNYVKELGSGWFGKVLQGDGQGILPGHKRTAAIVQALREDADRFEQYCFLQESVPYRDAEHPNVLKLLGQCIETVPYLTVLELCINGDLRMYLRNQRSNIEMIDKQGLLLSFACDMAAGLQAMHLKNYVHRDFAIRNCLVTSDLTVKIGDYGLSEEIYKDDYFMDPSGALIPIRWLAPEVISFSSEQGISLRQITKDCNLWSFGVALWEIVAFGSLPYAELSNEQVLKMVVYEGNIRLLRPEIPIANLDHLYELMEMCWMAPAQRPSLRELRIMLLHLQSSKDELDSLAFDQKWSQLLPRHHSERHGAIATIDAHDITVLPSGDDWEFPPRGGRMMGSSIMDEFQMLHDRNSLRSSRMDSRFSELDPTLLVHSGEFNPNLLSWSTFESVPTDLTSHHKELKLIPVNELSLEAEIAEENFPSFHAAKNGDFPEDEKEEFVFVSSGDRSSELKSDQNSKVAKINSADQILHFLEVRRPSANLREDFSEKPLLTAGRGVEVENSGENSFSDSFEELNREADLEKSPSDVSTAGNRSVEQTKAGGISSQLVDVEPKTASDLGDSLVIDITNNNAPNELLNFAEHSPSSAENKRTFSRDLSTAGKTAAAVSANGETDNDNVAVVFEDLSFAETQND